MDNEKIKELLLELESTDIEFTVTQSGKESKRVNGLYKPDTHEIILHNKNFKTENELIYTAIHEYTHHLIAEEQIKLNGSAYTYNAKVHTQSFWAKFHSLLQIAEEKKFYSIDIDSFPELKELTENIQKNYLEANGKLMMEFGKLLAKAHALCEDANIRYEDYLDRVLCLPRNSARDITRVGRVTDVDPAIGFDNMKMVSAIKKSDERQDAQQKIIDGQSPVTVREMLKKKTQKQETPREKLEKEKNRLSKTILQLQQRLDYVEETLATM